MGAHYSENLARRERMAVEVLGKLLALPQYADGQIWVATGDAVRYADELIKSLDGIDE